MVGLIGPNITLTAYWQISDSILAAPLIPKPRLQNMEYNWIVIPIMALGAFVAGMALEHMRYRKSLNKKTTADN